MLLLEQVKTRPHNFVLYVNLLNGDQFLQTNYFHRSAKSIFNHFLTACDVLHWYCACNVQCNTETFRTAVSYLTVVDASERISNIFPSDKAGFSLFFMFNGLYQEDFDIFE